MGTGIDLAHGYYRQVVGPLLALHRPCLPYAAARLGSGSDVLGLDDHMSRDHDWGLRLTLLVDAGHVDDVAALLERALPTDHAGRPTRFATTWDPVVRQRVEVATAQDFAASRLGLDASAGMDAVDWLCLTGQSLLEVTAGAVFTDTPGTLTELRRRLAWYPDDVWRYVVAADWSRLGQHLPLMGRAGLRGDDLGSRVLAGRLVATATHLAFLLARRWPPYPKWTGTLAARLPVAGRLLPALSTVLTATDWRRRQDAARSALDVLARSQHDAGLPVPSDGVVAPFFDRPFLTVPAATLDVLLGDVTDPFVRSLPPGIGSVEQWTDQVDLLTHPARRVRVARAQLAEAALP